MITRLRTPAARDRARSAAYAPPAAKQRPPGAQRHRAGRAVKSRLGEAELANAAGNFELATAQSISAALDSFVSLTPPNETIR
jgi:hypothetical protein